MKIQFIAVLSLLSVMGCGEEETTTTTSTSTSTSTSITETGTTIATETGTTMTTETGTMTTETGTTVTTAKFSPTNGVWDVTMVSFTKNACNIEEDKKDLAFGLTNIDADRFSLRDMEDAEIAFECTLTGKAKNYTCSSVVMSDPVKPLDATLTMTLTPEVMFTSDTDAEMPLEMTVECTGADCAKASAATGMALPCLTEAVLGLHLVGS